MTKKEIVSEKKTKLLIEKEDKTRNSTKVKKHNREWLKEIEK